MPLIHPAAIYLAEVARYGSVRRAAERLHASASAVNRQILNLEAEYGVELFERLPRGMRLTAAGEALVRDVRRWRREHDRVRDHLQDLQGLRRGSVALGVMECFATHLMPDVVRRLMADYPAIALSSWVGGTEAIAERLAAGSIEIALAFNLPDHPEIEAIRRFDQPIGAIVAADHPLAGRRQVRLSECVAYPMVLPDYDLSSRSLLDALVRQQKLMPRVSLTSNSIEQMKRIIEHSDRFGLMSWFDVHEEVNAGRLTFVPIGGQRRLTETLVLATRRHGLTSGAARVVLESMEKALTAAQGAMPRT